MNVRELEAQRQTQGAVVTVGFTEGMSCSYGLLGATVDLSGFNDQGAAGVLMPWMGSKHLKIAVGVE